MRPAPTDFGTAPSLTYRRVTVFSFSGVGEIRIRRQVSQLSKTVQAAPLRIIGTDFEPQLSPKRLICTDAPALSTKTISFAFTNASAVNNSPMGDGRQKSPL
jgi:hypothetical protein